MSGRDDCINPFPADNAVDSRRKRRLRADIESGIENAHKKSPAGNNGTSSKLLDIPVHQFFEPDPVGNYVQRTVFICVGSNTPLVDISGVK